MTGHLTEREELALEAVYAALSDDNTSTDELFKVFGDHLTDLPSKVRTGVILALNGGNAGMAALMDFVATDLDGGAA